MTKEKWDKAATEIALHLEAIRQVASDNKIDHLSMTIYDDGWSRACYVSPEQQCYRVYGKDGIYESDCDFIPIGKYEIKKALTPASN